MQNKYLVIMPTYNELPNLEKSVSNLFEFNPKINLLIVDDNSPDGTGALAEKLAGSNKQVSVLHREQKQGLGPAYLAGFEYGFASGYTHLIEMDADGSHRAEDLPALLAESDRADLVIGSRWTKGGSVVNWPLSRKLISRIGNMYTRIMLNTKVKDMTAGFRVYSVELLEQLPLAKIASHGYSFQVEMSWQSLRAGAKIVEVPIVFVEREHGYSKMTSNIVFEALLLVTKWGLTRMFGRG